eukprot:404427-Pelagomonas_calceolata.AAC.1
MDGARGLVPKRPKRKGCGQASMPSVWDHITPAPTIMLQGGYLLGHWCNKTRLILVQSLCRLALKTMLLENVQYFGNIIIFHGLSKHGQECLRKEA